MGADMFISNRNKVRFVLIAAFSFVSLGKAVSWQECKESLRGMKRRVQEHSVGNFLITYGKPALAALAVYIGTKKTIQCLSNNPRPYVYLALAYCGGRVIVYEVKKMFGENSVAHQPREPLDEHPEVQAQIARPVPVVVQSEGPPSCCVCLQTAQELQEQAHLDFVHCYRQEGGQRILNHQTDYLCSACCAQIVANDGSCPLCRGPLVVAD